MSLNKDECHELFLFFNDKQEIPVSQITRKDL